MKFLAHYIDQQSPDAPPLVEPIEADNLKQATELMAISIANCTPGKITADIVNGLIVAEYLPGQMIVIRDWPEVLEYAEESTA